MALGRMHTCALAADSTAYCWGEASQGALGDGHQNDSSCTANGFATKCRSRPMRVASDAKFTALSAYGYNTCGIDTSRDLWCWGAGTGVLGDRHDSATTPVRVHPTMKFASISVGGGFACGMTAAPARAVCWGENSYGQLATGDQTASDVPRAVGGPIVFTAVVAGGTHACGTAPPGLYCWGNNYTGQLGIGTADTGRLTPAEVPIETPVLAIVAGGDRTCVLRSVSPTTLATYCWGGTRKVEDELNSRSPRAIAFGNARLLGVGSEAVCAIDVSERVYCWGGDAQILGLGVGRYNVVTTPEPVLLDRDFEAIRVGGYHTCAIDTDGAMWCWGLAHQGQLTQTNFPESCTRSDEFYRCTGVPVRVKDPE
jgi:alpha-tubulin suppressor-like RCC1 family protein